MTQLIRFPGNEYAEVLGIPAGGYEKKPLPSWPGLSHCRTPEKIENLYYSKLCPKVSACCCLKGKTFDIDGKTWDDTESLFDRIRIPT
jgi:hypothetical protein